MRKEPQAANTVPTQKSLLGNSLSIPAVFDRMSFDIEHAPHCSNHLLQLMRKGVEYRVKCPTCGVFARAKAIKTPSVGAGGLEVRDAAYVHRVADSLAPVPSGVESPFPQSYRESQ